MTLLLLSPLVTLLLGALVIWLLGDRVPTGTHGVIALIMIAVALALVIATSIVAPDVSAGFVWSTLNGVPLRLDMALGEPAPLFVPLLLVCGSITAGGVAWTFGRGGRALGLVFAGLLVQLIGGLLTAYSVQAIGALLGLGVAWLGGTIMQQATTAHNRDASFGGLALLVLALALLLYGAAGQLAGGAIAAGWWITGCAVLMGVVPRWATTPTAPLLVRAPVVALGLPLLGGFLFVRYALNTATTWPDRTTTLVLILGAFGLVIGAVNALVARRLGSVWAWQIVAQLALIVISFGTGQPAAGPIAAGLLAHTLVTSTAIGLAIGQLERATRTDVFALLPPLPRPLNRAGVAYGLAALSCAGIPPLLGYALRRVVLLLGQLTQPWVAPLLLAASTLLALSYVPTLLAFFRRPAFRSPLAQIDGRGGTWPLVLMSALLLGGLIPDLVWQYVLGDPAVQPSDQAVSNPVVALVIVVQGIPAATLISTAITALLVIVVGLLVLRAVRRERRDAYFAGGEPLDEEPGWPLPWTTLRRVLWFVILPERVHTQPLQQRVQPQRAQLTEFRQALERRYYLAVVVVSLISVLLLAAQ